MATVPVPTPDPADYPDPDELEDLDEHLQALCDLLPGPLGRPEGCAIAQDRTGLSASYLGQAYVLARDTRGVTPPTPLARLDRDERLVAVLNLLEYDDIEAVLEAEDPAVEAETIYRELLVLAREHD